MSLADRLAAVQESRKNASICAYQRMYNSLSDSDQKALDDAWNKGFPVTAIIAALRQEGHKTSTEAITTHRDGTCRCLK